MNKPPLRVSVRPPERHGLPEAGESLNEKAVRLGRERRADKARIEMTSFIAEVDAMKLLHRVTPRIPNDSLMCPEKVETRRREIRAAGMTYLTVAQIIGAPMYAVNHVFNGLCTGRGPVTGKVAAALGLLKKQDPQEIHPEIRRLMMS